MTSETPNNFYVAGGTLRPGAPSYVERQADQELYDRALAGDFCYVLTSRQMGKSSLMARVAKRLKDEAGVHTAIVDLTNIGAEDEDGSDEKWYYGVATGILDGLGLNVNLDEWWDERTKLPALQRLTKFFSDIVLAQTTKRVVIFVDEIDTTIKLPFADDFFAAIRACYNKRATEPEYNRLSFVLLGVASPSDLIKDTARTPFNIGHRIDLTDFTFEEARPLARGLGATNEHCEQALRRILHWTDGHPYLTQKLCQTVTTNGTDCDEARIDSAVESELLSPQASLNDSNLNFVRDRVTKSGKLTPAMLKVYRRIRRGEKVIDDTRSPVHSGLKLSGLLVQREERSLRVRNFIYERVFTDEWAKKAKPVDVHRLIRALSITEEIMIRAAFIFWLLAISLIETRSIDITFSFLQILVTVEVYLGRVTIKLLNLRVGTQRVNRINNPQISANPSTLLKDWLRRRPGNR